MSSHLYMNFCINKKNLIVRGMLGGNRNYISINMLILRTFSRNRECVVNYNGCRINLKDHEKYIYLFVDACFVCLYREKDSSKW